MRFISQLISDISRVLLRKLLKYFKQFNGIIILISYVTSTDVSLVIFCLNLNEALLPGKLLTKLALFKDGSSL